MAIAAILFSLWYEEIAKILKIIPKPHKVDNAGTLLLVNSVLISKAIPVAIMTTAVTMIFAPDAWKIVAESFKCYISWGFKSISDYDAVRTAFCFVTLLSAILAIYMWSLVRELWKLKAKLSSD